MAVIQTFSTIEAGVLAAYLCETGTAFEVFYRTDDQFGPRMCVPNEVLNRLGEFARQRVNPIRFDYVVR